MNSLHSAQAQPLRAATPKNLPRQVLEVTDGKPLRLPDTAHNSKLFSIANKPKPMRTRKKAGLARQCHPQKCTTAPMRKTFEHESVPMGIFSEGS